MTKRKKTTRTYEYDGLGNVTRETIVEQEYADGGPITEGDDLPLCQVRDCALNIDAIINGGTSVWVTGE